MKTSLFCLFFPWIFCFIDSEVTASEQEQRLIHYLMANYDLSVRPTFDAATPVKVTLRLSLRTLVDVNEKKHYLSAHFWSVQKWLDTHLLWNASDFGDIGQVHTPAARLWTPDLRFFNSAGYKTLMNSDRGNVILRSDGRVTWFSEETCTVTCNFDLYSYPFDEHVCVFAIGAWAQSVFQVELLLESEISEKVLDYHSHEKFSVKETSESLGEVRCPWNSQDHCSMIFYSLTLRRQSPYRTLFCTVLPALFLHIAAAFCFLTSGSSTRVILGVIISVAAFLLLFLLQDALLLAVKIPVIVIYLMVTVAVVVGAAICSILVESFRSRDASPIAHCTRQFIFGCLARMFFVSTLNLTKTLQDVTVESSSWQKTSTEVVPSRIENTSGLIKRGLVEDRLLFLLEEAHRATQRYDNRLSEEAKREYLVTERNLAATTCDRFFTTLVLMTSLAAHLHLFLFLYTGAEGH